MPAKQGRRRKRGDGKPRRLEKRPDRYRNPSNEGLTAPADVPPGADERNQADNYEILSGYEKCGLALTARPILRPISRCSV